MFEGWGSSWEWATSICTFTGRSHPSFLFDIICFVCIFYLFCNICVGLSVQGTSSHLRKVGFQAHKNTQRIIFRWQKYSDNYSLNFVKRESFHIEIILNNFQAHKNTQRIIFRLQIQYKYSQNLSRNSVKREFFHIEMILKNFLTVTFAILFALQQCAAVTTVLWKEYILITSDCTLG